MRQLSLNIANRPDARLSDFAGPSWALIIDAVRQLHTGHLRTLFLVGAEDCGKSHLLDAICESYFDTDKRAIRVSLHELLHASVEVLVSLEHFDIILLDDVECIGTNVDWQEALFHLINRSQLEQKQLVFASRVLPANIDNALLPDLLSRLLQAACYLLPSGEVVADRRAMLNAVVMRRGWRFDAEIMAYLLLHGPEKPGLMLKLLLQLEPLFFTRKRKPSRQEIRQSQKYIDRLLNVTQNQL